MNASDQVVVVAAAAWSVSVIATDSSLTFFVVVAAAAAAAAVVVQAAKPVANNQVCWMKTAAMISVAAVGIGDSLPWTGCLEALAGHLLKGNLHLMTSAMPRGNVGFVVRRVADPVLKCIPSFAAETLMKDLTREGSLDVADGKPGLSVVGHWACCPQVCTAAAASRMRSDPMYQARHLVTSSGPCHTSAAPLAADNLGTDLLKQVPFHPSFGRHWGRRGSPFECWTLEHLDSLLLDLQALHSKVGRADRRGLDHGTGLRTGHRSLCAEGWLRKADRTVDQLQTSLPPTDRFLCRRHGLALMRRTHRNLRDLRVRTDRR